MTWPEGYLQGNYIISSCSAQLKPIIGFLLLLNGGQVLAEAR
jgi:ascorbate-specific PTS system EIIC-type component UlaA